MLLRLVKKGAEACLFLDQYMGVPVVKKQRVSKPYRHPELDRQILNTRTTLEGRLLCDARRAGVSTPAVLQVDTASSTLTLEFLNGNVLRDSLPSMDRRRISKTFRGIGDEVAKMHNAGIVHGDLTTSNIIAEDTQLHLIDFGLGEYSSELESRGVDLHLLLRTLESSHSMIVEDCWKPFLEGYSRAFSDTPGKVIGKVREIRRRGRYIEERRQR